MCCCPCLQCGRASACLPWRPQTAQRSLTVATARYSAMRSAMSLLGPIMWGWLALDLALKVRRHSVRYHACSTAQHSAASRAPGAVLGRHRQVAALPLGLGPARRLGPGQAAANDCTKRTAALFGHTASSPDTFPMLPPLSRIPPPPSPPTHPHTTPPAKTAHATPPASRQAIGTDYARVVRAVFMLAQVRASVESRTAWLRNTV